jgi:hypothetical protein
MTSRRLRSGAAEPPYTVQRASPPLQGFFSQRCVTRSGLPVLAHACVAPEALHEAARRVDAALCNLPRVAARLLRLGASVQLIGAQQACSDLPQYAHLAGDARAAFNARGRGYGGLCPSCGEENLLRLASDRYSDHRDILTHELSHTVMDWGFPPAAAAVLRRRCEDVRAASAERWSGAYAASCASEFFAECSMWHHGSRGDFGRITPTPQEGRAWLASHDADAAQLLREVFQGDFPPVSDADEAADSVTELTSCATAVDVRSVGETASGAPAASTLLVWNGTGERVTLAWVPVSGDDVAYASVPPYGVVGQQTFEGHAWRIAAAQGGACLGVFVATAGLCRVRLGVEEAGAAMMIQPRRRGRAAGEAASSRPRRRGRASDAAEPR